VSRADTPFVWQQYAVVGKTFEDAAAYDSSAPAGKFVKMEPFELTA
jgi:hypothetical protein